MIHVLWLRYSRDWEWMYDITMDALRVMICPNRMKLVCMMFFGHFSEQSRRLSWSWRAVSFQRQCCNRLSLLPQTAAYTQLKPLNRSYSNQSGAWLDKTAERWLAWVWNGRNGHIIKHAAQTKSNVTIFHNHLKCLLSLPICFTALVVFISVVAWYAELI